MGDFRARKRPPPRGEGVAGWRGDRPLVAGVEFVHAPRLLASVASAHMRCLDVRADLEVWAGMLCDLARPGLCRQVVLAVELLDLDAARVVRQPHRAPTRRRVDGRAVQREKFRVNVASGGVGFCCVCHASDITPTRGTCATLPRLTSQVTLTSLLVCSSLSGILPTHRTPDAQLLAPTTTSAASDIPLAQRMVVPATVYTWHTAAQVLRPASDMPHTTDHGVGSSVSNMPHGGGRRACPRGRRAGHP